MVALLWRRPQGRWAPAAPVACGHPRPRCHTTPARTAGRDKKTAGLPNKKT